MNSQRVSPNQATESGRAWGREKGGEEEEQVKGEEKGEGEREEKRRWMKVVEER